VLSPIEMQEMASKRGNGRGFGGYSRGEEPPRLRRRMESASLQKRGFISSRAPFFVGVRLVQRKKDNE
jgi:hypothetical protein